MQFSKFGSIFLMVALLMSSTTVCMSQEQDTNPNWIFFQDIPNNKCVTISGTGWKLTIDDSYQVKFNATKGDSNSTSNSRWSQEANFEGVGTLKWTGNTLDVDMIVESRASYRYSEDKYEVRRERVAGSGLINFLVDGSGADYRTYREYVGTETRSASGRNSENISFSMRVDGARCRLSSFSMSVTMSGDKYETVTFDVSSSIDYSLSIEKKSDSERASSMDQFGLWQWNKERSKIYLPSVDGKVNFVIWNRGETLSWSLELENDVMGVNEFVTEQGDTIVTLNVSLDGSSARPLTFAKYKPVPEIKIVEEYKEVLDSVTFEHKRIMNTREEKVYNESDMFFIENISDGMVMMNYAVYNRFLGSLDMRSESMLMEFKNHRIMMINYKVGEVDKTALFRLEGLESLMDYL